MTTKQFELADEQIEILNRHETLGFADESSMVRAALDQLNAKLLDQELEESAILYAEIYATDKDLQELTESALEGWPE